MAKGGGGVGKRKSQRREKRDGDGLTRRQRLFALEYLVDFNATQAAIRAGYSARTARQQASDLLAKPYIKAFIDEAVRKREEQLGSDAERVITELRLSAYFDPLAIFEDDGVTLKRMDEIPQPVRRAIESFEVVEYFEPVEDEEGRPRRTQVGWLKKVKLRPKDTALQLLGKKERLFADRVEHAGSDGKPLQVAVINPYALPAGAVPR